MKENITTNEKNNYKENKDSSGFKSDDSHVIEMSDANLYAQAKHEPCNSVQDFINETSKFSEINPLRKNRTFKKKNKETAKNKSKKIIIEELVTNLRTQYVLFNIKHFVRKYLVTTNPKINSKSYKIQRIIRNLSLFLYGILMFFEKPWYCHPRSTIKLPLKFQEEECKNNIITFANIPFIEPIILRVIEIVLTIIIAVTQVLKYKDEYYLVTTNEKKMNKSYKIMNIILLISLIICLIDLFTAIITNSFPIVNFLLRAFNYIYLTRRLRKNWKQIGKVLWKTKPVFFFLILNILIFSLIGYILFKNEKSKFFQSFRETVFQLYILLSTCNFPDIMLETFTISKFSVFYFIIYVSINYFIILSYLKTLYYTKYYSVNKEYCIKVLKKVILKKEYQNIFLLEDFKKFIVNEYKKYSLNDDEYNNFLMILNLYGKDDNILADSIKKNQKKPEDEFTSSSVIGNLILNNLIIEILINVINLLSVGSLFIDTKNNILLQSLNFIWCFIISMRFIFLIYTLGIKRVVVYHFNRILFHFFNFASIILIIILLFSNPEDNEDNYEKIYNLFCIFIVLRTIRIFVFLDKFKQIGVIYSIIKISKEMFYRNLMTLYSLYLIFSTLSILLTGGNIKKNSFDDDDIAIPRNYTHINFNDFGSSYISCFSLMMINNLQILVKSLTHNLDNNKNYKEFLEFYFASFYFFSTLIIVNIIQTLLLEMYLNSGFSLNEINEKKEKLIENKKEKKEHGDNEYKVE